MSHLPGIKIIAVYFSSSALSLSMCALWLSLLDSVQCQSSSPLPPTTPNDGGDFFDDDNNKAMYLVLPAMVLVYGGCAMIYCVHRCRRYCIRKSKARLKEEKRRNKQKERLQF
ncbi:hypothetical protein PoB_002264200 [Plakobranchus ocellatus]|uniref:Uncharacterized protein n=1 Tax=Plakobranchus ocellatus TaxID=259542 RepID=A0AAV3ZLJ7_9GAST|nr:hypothetical protein PoB_002264200 [Plakobranchus ocellatus]